LFVSDRGGQRGAWLLDLEREGAEPIAAPEIDGAVSEAVFSPDGRFIAAIATPDAQRRVVAARGWRSITRLRYRADGVGYLDDFPVLWLIDLEASTARPLTDGTGAIANPAWSPDGRTVAFVGEHRPEADSLYHTELWLADIGGIAPVKIASLAGAVEAPSWSTDGSTIAFVGHDDGAAYSLAPLRLHTVRRDGSALACLTPGVAWTAANALIGDLDAAPGALPPRAASDGSWLVMGTSAGTCGVYRVGTDRRADRLTPTDCSIADFSVANGELAATASDSASPPEIYACAETGERWRRLTFETQTWALPRRFERARKFVVEAGDHRVDAWHLRGSGDAPRPCVLEVHGGPHFSYGETFMFEFQMLAQAGYDVVFANPRGSQGYGEAFARAIVGDWAQPAFDDCIAALDRALAGGEIESRRMGVAGGSYGGYLTLWILAHDRRFGAGVAMRCASNLESLWGTSEVGRMLDVELGTTPAADPELYRRCSPLPLADRITAPLLLLHAENDFRCPIEQAEQVFTALKRRGATVEFIRYSGADHGLTRGGPPKLRVAHWRATLGWFDRYIGTNRPAF
ncbi:MAG TPA: S9 family peptidase, partial [Candidatus Eremiobacteraceae bacterium]|nr:S9 family peptidase [Candidatus Eremiobacteraceae bacterium]